MSVAQKAEAPELARVAQQLAEANGNSDPAVSVVYWFPAQDQIRLVVVDDTIAPTPAGQAIAPFYFGADRKAGIPYPSAIALIAPTDERQAQLPAGWDPWDAAKPLWRRP